VFLGLVSSLDYFSVHNGVRQGDVLSPILFCVYIDNLLQRLSRSGVGCYLGTNLAGTLAHANTAYAYANAYAYAKTVLVYPTPSAIHKLLLICDAFATEYNIKFKA